MSDFGGFSEFTVYSVIRNAWKLVWRKPLAFFGITFPASIQSTVIWISLTHILIASFSWFNVSGDFITTVIRGVTWGISTV